MKSNPDQLWAQIIIRVHPNEKRMTQDGCYQTNHYHWHVLKEWNYPRWIIKKHDRFFSWVRCIYQVRFKNYRVDSTYCGYYPETKERLNSKRLNSISAAKAQITKVENAIAVFKEEKGKTLWNDYENDPIYKKLLCKLDEKKFKHEQAVMQNIEDTI